MASSSAAASASSLWRGSRGAPFRVWGGLPFGAAAAPFSSAWGGGGGGGDLLQRMDQRETWDRFYAAKTKGAAGLAHFDWFFGYQDVSGSLLSILRGLPSATARVLDVGCGTSALGLGLYRDSPRPLEICCLDFSKPALDALGRLLRQSPPPGHPLSRVHCRLADATELTRIFGPGSFHLVLDKGTCDALLRCPEGPGRARKLLTGCLKVLKREGILLQFSDEDPDARVPFLERAGEVDVTVQEMEPKDGIRYYAYKIGRRTPNLEGLSGPVRY